MNSKKRLEELTRFGPALAGSEAAELRREFLLGEVGMLTLLEPQEEAFQAPASQIGGLLGFALIYFLLLTAGLVSPIVALVGGMALWVLAAFHIWGRALNWLSLSQHQTLTNISAATGHGRPVVLIHASLVHRSGRRGIVRLTARWVTRCQLSAIAVICLGLMVFLGPVVVGLFGASGLWVMASLSMGLTGLVLLYVWEAHPALSAAELTGPLAALRCFELVKDEIGNNAEVRLVMTEGDQYGLAGIRTYLDRHKDSFIGRPLAAICFDHIGAGVPTLASQVGNGLIRRLDGRLFRAADQIRKALDAVNDRRPYAGSDVAALALSRFGADTALLIGLDALGDRAGTDVWQTDDQLLANQLDQNAHLAAEALIEKFRTADTKDTDRSTAAPATVSANQSEGKEGTYA